VIRAFVVQADSSLLEAICDKYLNNWGNSGGIVYRPAIDRVVVARLDAGRVFPQQPGQFNYGYISETDVSLFIPVVKFDGVLPVGLGLFPPYIFVDHPWGVLTGREVFGLPKIPSTISALNTTTAPYFAVTTYAAQTLGSGQLVQQQQVLSVLANGAVDMTKGYAIKDSREGWDTILEALFGDADAFEVVVAGQKRRIEPKSLLTLGTLPLVTLKEFRDVADGNAACYQALVEAPAQVTTLDGVSPMAGNYQVQIGDFVSLPIRADFGWNQGVPVQAALQIGLDFVMGAGQEVRRA
jgi:hypothetical protein